MHHKLELAYLPIKCIGLDICQNACLNACPEGAISKGAPEEALDKSGVISKAVIDRSTCTNCTKCSNSCVTKALFASGWDTTVDEVFERLNKDRDFFGSNGGVSICGGEPLAQIDFTVNLARRLKDSGLHVCLDTTGYCEQEVMERVLPYIDLYLYDIKHMNSEMHQKLTGVKNDRILSNARFLAGKDAALQIRVPIIPKLSDTDINLRQTAEFCASLGDAVTLVQLLPYHISGKMKYDRLGLPYKLSKLEPPDNDFLNKTLELFKSYGLNSQLH